MGCSNHQGGQHTREIQEGHVEIKANVCVLCVVEVSDSSRMGPLGQINQRTNLHSEAQHVLLDMCFLSCQFYKNV